MRVELVCGDITNQEVDAIVNAANSRLMIGGGVDGAIHSAGGPEIREDTQANYPEGCPTGQAVISCAGRLNAQYVIHAVGPVWRGEDSADLLASAYAHAFTLANDNGCRTVALPAISTGAYGYPIESAAKVALKTALDFEADMTARFVLFDMYDYHIFEEVLHKLNLTSSLD